jgi:protein phosphatase
VITRALGATDDVDVDTWRVDAEDGDLFLLCSDGLTDMVDDASIAETLNRDLPLERILDELVRKALDAGGDDNITAVAFRVGWADGAAPPRRAERSTVEMETPDALKEDTLTEADRVPPVEVPDAPPPAAPDREPVGVTPVTTIRPAIRRQSILPQDIDEPAPRRSIVKPLIVLLVIAILAVAAVAGSIAGLRWSHFVGVDPATGRVAVYEGVPFDITSSHTLYRKIYTSPTLYAAQLSAKKRHALFDHKLQSRDDALAEVHALEKIQP